MWAFAAAFALGFAHRSHDDVLVVSLGKALVDGASEHVFLMQVSGATEEIEQRFEYDFGQWGIGRRRGATRNVAGVGAAPEGYAFSGFQAFTAPGRPSGAWTSGLPRCKARDAGVWRSVPIGGLCRTARFRLQAVSVSVCAQGRH